jgi:hypothetical protein
MDQNLQRLARALRTERCPARVRDKVQQQIDRHGRPVHPIRLRAFGVALCLAAVAALGAHRYWPIGHATRPLPPPPSAQADQARVAREASLALAYIGGVLLEAKEHNQTVLLNKAVPRLRSSFETASKIIQTKL